MAKTDDGKPIKVEDRSNGQIVVKPQSTVVSRRRSSPRRSWTRWFLSNFARLFTWYSLLTILFRCPSTPQSLDAQSPQLCKHYFTAKTYAQPYVQPYYDTYASRYVDKAQPYLDTANDRVVRPATAFALKNYERYAAPQVTRARTYAKSQWEKNALPKLRKVQESAQQAYDENLAHQVLKVSEVATPYYETAKENALNAHEKHIIPAITYSQPHLYKAYVTVYKFALERLVPFAQNAWSHAVIFVDGTLWPFIKKVYGDNVRPQLVMIGERIAKYQEGRKLQSAMDEVDRSFESTDTSQTTTSAEQVSSSTATTTTASSTIETPTSSLVSASQAPGVATDETIAEDLVKWQKKFATAADKGTDDLKERIEEIVTRLKKSGLSEGTGLANVLEKSSDIQLNTIQAKIKSVVSLLPEEAESHDNVAAESEIFKAIQEAGLEIKTRARAVRAWRETYLGELKQRTELATESTLHVLDDIRDLGLQEIGMRWAWMEGVTYKHWQKYHELKRRFADWRSEVREAALNHPALLEASVEAEKVWEESMAVTENAAKELIRLRDVAKWKISARDSSDDFDSRAIPVVAAAASAISAASSLASDIKGALSGSSQDVVESVSSVASGSVAEASQSASVVAGDGQNMAESLLSRASSAINPNNAGTVESLVEGASSIGSSVGSSASTAMEEMTSSASSKFQTSSAGSIESMASSMSSKVSSALASGSEKLGTQLGYVSDSASSIALSATTGPSEGLLSSASSFVDSVSSSALSAADASKSSQSLLDIVNKAGEKATEVTSSWLSKE